MEGKAPQSSLVQDCLVRERGAFPSAGPGPAVQVQAGRGRAGGAFDWISASSCNGNLNLTYRKRGEVPRRRDTGDDRDAYSGSNEARAEVLSVVKQRSWMSSGLLQRELWPLSVVGWPLSITGMALGMALASWGAATGRSF